MRNKTKNTILFILPMLFFVLFFIVNTAGTSAHPDYIEPADRTFGSCPTWLASCHNYIENPSGHPECSYDALSPYFGEKTWVAQEIASGESSCDPSVENGSSAGAGLFQIERSVWCNGTTYTCNGESVTLSSNISTCTSQLLNAKNNKIVACYLENDRDMWGHWGVEGSCWGTVPEHKCNLVPSVLNKYCPYSPGAEPQASDGTCGTWSSEDGTGGGGASGTGGTSGSGEDTTSGCAPALAPIVCNVDWPAIPVPDGTFDLNAYCVGGQNPEIGVIVQFAYAATIWLAGIIAFISLLVTGVMYIFSGANPSVRAKAKGRILNLLWGLVIIFLASLLLFFINPDTTTLKISGMHAVDPGNCGNNDPTSLPDTGDVDVDDSPPIVTPEGTACPVANNHWYTNDWLACRSGGSQSCPIQSGCERDHKGVDIFARLGTKAFAMEGGVVKRVGNSGGSAGLRLYLHGDSGHVYSYFHLKDFAPGISSDTRVSAGQHIAYVGCSGTAGCTFYGEDSYNNGPHLHFEVKHPSCSKSTCDPSDCFQGFLRPIPRVEDAGCTASAS
ncbi:MAG: peptidoglycan DD-metalloendopeptidase family protein [Candidatus Spechtbacterales bacterium]